MRVLEEETPCVNHRCFRALAAAALTLSLTAQAENHAPNPYAAERGWGQLPDGRSWGSTSAIYPAPDGKTMWVADRCEQNSCIGKEDLDPIFQFDLEGNLLRSFGAGLITWPHGMFVDAKGNVWVTDARGDGTRGHQYIIRGVEDVIPFSRHPCGRRSGRRGRERLRRGSGPEGRGEVPPAGLARG